MNVKNSFSSFAQSEAALLLLLLLLSSSLHLSSIAAAAAGRFHTANSKSHDSEKLVRRRRWARAENDCEGERQNTGNHVEDTLLIILLCIAMLIARRCCGKSAREVVRKRCELVRVWNDQTNDQRMYEGVSRRLTTQRKTTDKNPSKSKE